ncbi:diiron oxygenase [Actinocorallia populi]|uniref:diiron oxygenase n=1 Tax=Actinocorallia populi TaxID=2079200 RepID=UPI000D086C1B|nr:diiron oxygenase [Actinocorallia populi]
MRVKEEPAFAEMVERLSAKSRHDHYNPYTRFTWPDRMDDGSWWMSPEHLTVHGTGLVGDERVLRELARRETVNFFSLHVHGIRELMIEVSRRIHTPRFAAYSEYLHHFVGEENAHMWFFAEFCNRYAGGIYPDVSTPYQREVFEEEWEDVVVFARILIFEEIFDYYNSRMGRDRRLPEILQELHSVHHHDESRHVAFGKQFLRHLYAHAVELHGQGRTAEIEDYVKAYMAYSVRSLYNPHAYRDAGVARPLEVRREAMAHPAREEIHRRVMARIDRFFVSAGIFGTPWGGEGVAV